MGVNSLLNIGGSALIANQTALHVTGNNVANVNTEGYSRQTVEFNEMPGVNSIYGRLGNGVQVTDIIRSFDRFVEDAFLDQSTLSSRWDTQSTVMQTVQSIFNESNTIGINDAMSEFFNSWQDLSLWPDDMATREELISNSSMMLEMIQSARESLDEIQYEMDRYIQQDVDKANEIVEEIQALNEQITRESVVHNANDLLDKRDQLVRDLAEIIDIRVDDKGSNNFSIYTTSGLPLLDINNIHKLELHTGRVENNLVEGSTYDGTLLYSGEDTHEYLFEVVTPPEAGTEGTMRVSLDGGKTWMRNEDGSEYLVSIPDAVGQTVQVKDLEISFNADPTTLTAGDQFEVLPFTGLYWNEPTRPPLNITPQVLLNGSENGERVTGGTLAAYFSVRDHHIGRYEDKLDAMANSLIWEVNRIHSQGAPAGGLTHVLGTYQVDEPGLALGVSGSGLDYSSRLTTGNVSFQIYDDTGEPIQPLPEGLDFDLATDGVQMFDPQKHSINDVANAINGTYGAYMQADVLDGRLQLTALNNPTHGSTAFAINTDSTGLMAALGINTFFTGTDALTLELNSAVVNDPMGINSGKVNNNGDIDPGDNSIALSMADLATKTISFNTGWENTSMTLGEYYNTTVSVIGAETRTSISNADYIGTLADDLEAKSSAVSGVNLDEEMTSLIKFQHSYTAAAKLITTADEMLQTILSMKQ